MKIMWTQSLIRFVAFQAIVLITLIFVMSWSGNYSKRVQSEMIVSSLRNSYMVGDLRSVIDILTNASRLEFEAVKIFDHRNKMRFTIGKIDQLEMPYSAEVLILSTPGKLDTAVGKVVFYYEMLNSYRNAFYSWVIFFILSLPYLILEKRKIKERLENSFKMEQALISKNVADKVSHDIRSPVIALRNAIGKLTDISHEESRIISLALNRIEHIANDLLSPSKEINQTLVDYKKICIRDALDEILIEKRLELARHEKVKYEIEVTHDIYIFFDKIKLKTIISNLINNSIEAFDKNEGRIKLEACVLNEKAYIRVIDNGKGISKNIIERIGEKGCSYGKKTNRSGSGLGIYNAKEELGKVQGELKIYSVEGFGTTIEMVFPNYSEKKEGEIYDFVYIDDDELMREIWKGAAKSKGIKLLVLSSVQDFDNYKDQVKFDTKIYIDSELGEGVLKGEEFAQLLHSQGYLSLFIASGHPADRFQHLKWLQYSSKKCPF